MAGILARVAVIAALLSCMLAWSCGGDSSDGSLEGEARVWEPSEITIDAPVDVANPFDPAQADLTATFVPPSGEAVTVTGFATQDYSRELVDGKEGLTPQGELGWRVRFTPGQAGDWTWTWSLRTQEGTQTGEAETLHVSEPRSGRHGFLRVSPEDSRYLQFDDGTPYFAIGENLSWYDQRGTYAYDDWFEKLAAVGANYVRLWMPSWAFGLEWTDPNTLGDYTQRLDRAWQLDYVLEQAREHGIYVLLCLQNHGPFSLTANSEWDANPYNQANGGPLARPQDVFTNTEAKSLFERRFRYVAARWAASPNVLGWELWNEVDLASTELPNVLPWHEEMAAALRDMDPYDHLITTSTSLPWGIAAVSATDLASFDTPLFEFWQQENIDIAQMHLYALGGSSIDFSAVVPEMSDNLRRFGKPVLLAEAGVSPSGPAETLEADSSGAGFHDMLWSGLVAQTMGTGMSWWWDNVVDPEDWYFHFSAVARATDGVDFPREQFQAADLSVTAAPDQRISATGLIGETAGLLWIKNARNQWYSLDRTEVTSASVTLSDLPQGSWQATWINTYTNEIAEEADITVTDGALVLIVPTFERDIALRLDKKT